MLNTHKTENTIKRIKHRYYEEGDKAGKLLAWQIKKEETNMAIYTIQKDDTFTSNPREINEAFLSYYQSLYTSQGCNTVSIQHFLDKLVLPTLSDDKKERLEGSITKEEVMKALTLLASGKSPGHDGFLMEFFKTFIPKLIEPMISMFNYAIETGRFPESLEQALIIVLLKPGKDPKLCSSYRPISILPSDYKKMF